MTTDASDLQILDTAGRVAMYAESILEAHAFGHGPGAMDEPWTRSFHDAVVHVYPQTIPWPYLLELADRFVEVGRHMTARGSQTSDDDDWIIVSEYVRNGADAIRLAAPADVEVSPSPELGSRTPSVVKFELLAEVAGDAGANRLRTAGRNVQRSMADRLDANPLTAEQIFLLQRLVAGDNVADLTDELGYSERSLYRKLHLIWDRLGVESRSQGLAMVIARGWLGAPASTWTTRRG